MSRQAHKLRLHLHSMRTGSIDVTMMHG